MRIASTTFLIVILSSTADAEPNARQLAGALLDDFHAQHTELTAQKRGSSREATRDELREKIELSLPLRKGVARALSGVLDAPAGWAEERRILGLDGAYRRSASTTHGDVFAAETPAAAWVEVERLTTPGVNHGGSIWGQATLEGDQIIWRGRRWSVPKAPLQTHPVPAESARLYRYLADQATILLGGCTGTGCERQGRSDLAWVKRTLRLARDQGVAPTMEAGGRSLQWQLRVHDRSGTERMLTLKGIGAPPPNQSQISAAPLSVEGRERRYGPSGATSREFVRAHFDYTRRVRIAQPRLAP